MSLDSRFQHLRINLRGSDVLMPQHACNIFYGYVVGKCQRCERVPGKMENIVHLRNWKNIENKLVTGCELADFLYSASVIGKQFGTEY